MLVHEESLVLQYLRRHVLTRLPDLLSACVPGASAEWGNRILSSLEWLGYVAVFPGHGETALVQLTPRGMQAAQSLSRAGRQPNPAAAS